MTNKARKSKFRRYKATRILFPRAKVQIDDTLVSEIAESMKIHGQLQPITVRRCSAQENLSSTKFEVIAGVHRLHAAKVSGARFVDCVVVDADDTQARLMQIAENLWRKNLTVLERSELLSEWMTLASAQLNPSGQVVQKGKLGRPSSGIALAARKLPAIGRSVEARRKIIDRAIKIAHLSPEAKDAVRKSGLDKNQKKLLKIAKAGNWKAQVKKAEELATTAVGHGSEASRLTEELESAGAKVSEGSLSLRSASKSNKSANQDATGAKPRAETTFEDLERFWDKKGRRLWAFASAGTRQRFVEKLNRAVCKARPDIERFVQDAMQGRELLSKKELAALAVAKGLSKSRVLKAANSLYSSKRKGLRWNAEWFFCNKNSDWKDHCQIITNSELRQVLKATPDPRSTESREWGAE